MILLELLLVYPEVTLIYPLQIHGCAVFTLNLPLPMLILYS